MFSLICAWINGWLNNREAGDLRRHRAHYDVTVMANAFANVLKWLMRIHLHESLNVSCCGNITYLQYHMCLIFRYKKPHLRKKCLIHIKSNANRRYQMCVSVKTFNPNYKHTPRSNEDGIRTDSRFVPSQWDTALLCICYLPSISQLLQSSNVQFVNQDVRSWQRRSSEQKDLTMAFIRHLFWEYWRKICLSVVNLRHYINPSSPSLRYVQDLIHSISVPKTSSSYSANY